MSTIPDGINFAYSVAKIEKRSKEIMRLYEEWYADFIGKKFKSKNEFFQMYEQTESWGLELTCIYFLESVHPKPSIRAASSKSIQKFSDFNNKWSMNTDLYNTIEQFYNSFKHTLVGEEKTFLTRLLEIYRRNGIHLDKKIRDKLEKINTQIDTLSIKYNSNLNELDDHLFFTKEELDGVDEDFINRSKNGKYKITTKSDHIDMVMSYCNVESTRKSVNEMFSMRGKIPYHNDDMLKKTLVLRLEYAKLLGYNSYSEYVLSYNRMAKTPKHVDDFLNGLVNKLKPIAVQDAKTIANHFKKDHVESWNLAYYTNLYKKDVLQYDQKIVQEYFPLESLLPKLLGTFEDIFQLKIEEIELMKHQTWHESVKCYAVYDKTNNEILGHFYIDLYPRDGKYGHAAAFPLKSAYISTCDVPIRSTPVSAMVCNFTRPTKDKPSLLTFGEVNTFFHELGHIFHQTLSKNRFSMFSGTSVETDFVECPSQALENWCYEETFLKRISSHYKTGKPIPTKIMNKIKKNKTLFNGLFYIRQLIMALYDMKIHSNETGLDVEKVYNEYREQLSPLIYNTNDCIAANFAHLMSGYESGYYGYLWSEVYAAEVFQLFKKSGDIFNSKIGLKYRQCILEKGGTETGFKMMEDLLGRKPNSDAFMKSI